MKTWKTHPILKITNSTFIDMPVPSNITFLWNFGSLLAITLLMQILTGFSLTIHYTPDSVHAFSSITLASRDIPLYWLTRWLHANGASLMFLLMYLHIARNIYFSSSKKKETWLTGLLILMMTMATAFMGYVLPWGQMSFWGVTVITNLLSTLPYIGPDLVTWLWGGFSVENPTLKRFYSIHYSLPLLLSILVLLHLAFLHQSGSSNPLNLQNQSDLLHFHPHFTYKDLLGFMTITTLFSTLILSTPLTLCDPENFSIANPMTTPPHIQPEWYFLFAYAILRCIPSKLGGVIALTSAILILALPPFLSEKKIPLKFHPLKKLLFWDLIFTFTLLTWSGMNPISYPFFLPTQILTLKYFILIPILFT